MVVTVGLAMETADRRRARREVRGRAQPHGPGETQMGPSMLEAEEVVAAEGKATVRGRQPEAPEEAGLAGMGSM